MSIEQKFDLCPVTGVQLIEKSDNLSRNNLFQTLRTPARMDAVLFSDRIK